MRYLKFNFSEIYLIIAVFFYWISASVIINWFGIGLLLTLIILLLSKSRILGITIGILWIFINIYMILAMFSELSEFPSFNNSALKLLVVGSIFFGLNLILSGMLVYKYTSPTLKVNL